ncbi:TPR repeat-containing protein [Tieghemostelium lacteum]|uniref:TPR repeat-containing protein n=1 Tax=Tieghemostelium lacteum TaxID=361077 RepID=A0A152A562_TIELA|nr:TPR repeat-containing protein [Tieghemostelium lacteum]|eukprot:KYR01370.1 TPR repeat-containing protein [Tieghemostelium lacteum]
MAKTYKDKNVYILLLPQEVKEKFQQYFVNRNATLSKRFSKTVNLIITNKIAISENKFPLSTAKSLDIEIVDYETLTKEIDRYNKKKSKSTTTITVVDGASTKTIVKPTTTSTESTNKQLVVSTNNKQIVPISKSTSTTTSLTNSTNNISSSDPVISLVVPPSGSNLGGYQISVFGVGFVPGPLFRIQFGTGQYATGYEFHSTTAVLCTVPTGLNLSIGQVGITASNDGGKTFGYPLQFLIYDSNIYKVPTMPEQEAVILKAQLQNLKRAVANIQQMEALLIRKFATLSEEKLEGLYQLKLESGSGDILDVDKDLEEDDQEFQDDSDDESDMEDTKADQSESPSTLKDEFEDREIKIFISSPFKDMMMDRDQIVKVVIPKIRKLCIERDIIMTYVDLRWGVTSTQSEQGTGLAMCLKELEKSNILVGLFGERYGWSSQERSDPKTQQLLTNTLDKAATDYPWVNKYRDSSITEIEFRMVLNNHSSGKNGFFYFRDPYYIEELPQKEKNNFVSEGQRSKEKLDKLKQEITKSQQFRSAEYRRPSNLADILYEDLEKYIDKRFPSGNVLSGQEKERFLHSVFAKNLCKIYIQNDHYYMAIDTFLTKSKTPVLLVQGDAGMGKSSLLTNWLQQHKDQHPEDLLVSHWIGASPNSNQYSKCLIRIMSEIRYLIERDSSDENGSGASSSLFSTKSSSVSWIPDIPDEDSPSEKIAQEFSQFIQFTMTHPSMNSKRLIIILDGLDKLDSRESSTELIWFPRQFPSNVKFIVSASGSSRPADVLKKRKHQVLTLNQFTEAERKALVRLYLQKFAKKLSDQQEIQIATSNSTSNPRFLQLLLDDICVFGDFERLGERILRLLKARNTAELYEIILDRIESDYDVKGKGLVREFLRYIWGGRRGIELDLLTNLLLKKGIDPAEWNSLLVLMEAYISSSSGLLSFLNSDITQAVEKKYITSDKIRIEIHSEIAEAFTTSHDLSIRKVEELPYQLCKSANWEDLKTCLIDLHMFDKLYTPNNKGDLINYWNILEKQFKPPRNAAERSDPIPYSCSAEFKAIVARSFIQASGLVISDVWYHVASFLEEISQYDGAEVLYLKCRELYVNSSQNVEAAKVDRAMGRMYHLMSKYDLAEQKFKQALTIYTKEKGQEDIEVAITLNLLGSLATTDKKHEDAKRMLNQAMQICESKYDSNQLLIADIAYSLGSVHFVEEARRLDIAETYFQKALELTELKLGDMDVSYARILNRLGSVYIEKDQYKDAETCFKMALKIYEARLGIEHSRVAQILRQLISLYEIQEDYKTAEQCALRALAITKKIFGPTHTSVAGILIRLGILYQSMEKKDQCLQILNEARALREKEFGVNHKQVQQVVTIIKNITSPPPVVIKTPPPPPPMPKTTKPASFLDEIKSRPGASSPSVPIVSHPPGYIPPPPPPPPMFVPTGYIDYNLAEIMKKNKPSLIAHVQPSIPIPPSMPTKNGSSSLQQQQQQLLQQQQQQLQQLQSLIPPMQQQQQQQQQLITPTMLQQKPMMQQQMQQPMSVPPQKPMMQQPMMQQHSRNRAPQPMMQQPQQQMQQPQQAFGDMIQQQQNLKKVHVVQDRSNASDAINSLIGQKRNNMNSHFNNKLNMNEASADISSYFA